MPIVGMLAGRYPARYIIAAGWLALAIGMYVSTVRLDTLISFQSATVLRLIQSVGLGLLFVPVTMAGYIGMPADKANNVAGLINFMRNIGSSVGTSMVTTLLARRAQVHQVVLAQHTTPFDRSVQNQVKALSVRLVHSGSSVADAPKRAYGLLYGLWEDKWRTRLHRYFLGADHRGEHHVSARLHRSQKRSQGQWRYGCRLDRFFANPTHLPYGRGSVTRFRAPTVREWVGR